MTVWPYVVQESIEGHAYANEEVEYPLEVTHSVEA